MHFHGEMVHFFLNNKALRRESVKLSLVMESYKYLTAWRQKIAILIRMQFLNNIIKSEHDFKTAQKFHKF